MSEIRTAEIWEDGLRTDPKKKSFEWWYFDANFSDGSTAVITFFTKSPSNPGGPIRPQVQIVINTPTGEKLNFGKFYAPNELSAKKDQCDVKIGPNTVIGNLKKYKIHLELPEISGDFEFDRIAPSYSTAPSKPSNKPVYFSWFCAIPYGTVKAKFKYSGIDKTASGTGYHDHNWGIINIKDVCDYWYWGRATAGDYAMIFTVMYLPKILGGGQASVFYLAKGDKILIEDSTHLTVSSVDITPPPTVTNLPTKIAFDFKNDEFGIDFSFSNPKLIEKSDPLQDEPSWKKFVTRLFSKPLYVRYNADMDFNITTENKKKTIKGNGLYEIMILH